MVTKLKFERLFLLMNHTNMYIQVTFLEHFLSQNSHSKCFFSSWTEATWFNKLLFLEKQWLQSSDLRGFSCLWTEATCQFKSYEKIWKILKITAQTYHPKKMQKLNWHIFQYKKFFVKSKNRTLSLQIVSHGVPLG